MIVGEENITVSKDGSRQMERIRRFEIELRAYLRRAIHHVAGQWHKLRNRIGKVIIEILQQN